MKRETVLLLALQAATMAVAQENQKVNDGAAAPAGKTPKLETHARSKTFSSEGTVPVLIVYKNQPLRGILQQVEARTAPQRMLAEADSSRMNRLTSETRATVRREVEAAIGTFQIAKADRLEGAGAVGIQRFWIRNMISAGVPAELIPFLAADEDVAEILPAPVLRASVTNDGIDPNTGVLGVASFWNAGIRGVDQPIVILDTGINASHAIFAGKDVVALPFLNSMRRSRCFDDDATSGSDNVGHGTHVAGIAAGAGDSFLPLFQGTAPGVSQVIALKVGAKLSGVGNCGSNGFATADIISGIQFALENTNARIMNMSFGGDVDEDDPGLAQVIDILADDFGVTVTAAAGNSGNLGVPAIGDTGASYNGITVANWNTRGTFTKSDDAVATSSSRGPTVGGRFKPDVAAPGSSILSASNTSNTALIRLSGTSMASPKVAGVAAVLHQAGIKKPAEVKALLINTSDQIGWREDRGWGFLNLERANSQRNVQSGEVGPGGFALFRGRVTGNLFATLVWNRHMVDGRTSAFHDLDLIAFDGSGNEIGKSETSIQNVEQVAIETSGDVILKVKAFDETFQQGLTREQFALAISDREFTPATGVVLAIGCSANTSEVARGANFSVTCRTTNTGDLTGSEVALTLNGSTVELGNLTPGQSQVRTFQFTAPSQAGQLRLEPSATASVVGETVKGVGSALQIAVR